MKALLLVAHGSRRNQSNSEVLILADKLKGHCSEQYAIVHAAFLELAEPEIPEGIKHCVDHGATSIVVLPYFLNSGRHVTEDIPNIVNSTKRDYPNIDIGIAAHIGGSDLMMKLLVTSANSEMMG
ncbi:MAG: sirohydrochlorin ferrochelatase [Porticoccaceae bacterium]|jgi:sirohydrochlorin ferrochelatase